MNYGFYLQFNGLKPKDDHFFIKENDQIILEDFGKSLKKSKLRMDNLVIPLHFELGPTDSRGYAEKFRIGVGGYAGLNLADRKSTRLNSSHVAISYAVFCLKK